MLLKEATTQPAHESLHSDLLAERADQLRADAPQATCDTVMYACVHADCRLAQTCGDTHPIRTLGFLAMNPVATMICGTPCCSAQASQLGVGPIVLDIDGVAVRCWCHDLPTAAPTVKSSSVLTHRRRLPA